MYVQFLYIFGKKKNYPSVMVNPTDTLSQHVASQATSLLPLEKLT